MTDNKAAESTKEVDIYRDTLLRYLGEIDMKSDLLMMQLESHKTDIDLDFLFMLLTFRIFE